MGAKSYRSVRRYATDSLDDDFGGFGRLWEEGTCATLRIQTGANQAGADQSQGNRRDQAMGI